MLKTNRIAGRIAAECSAHATTDVTGFGFAGHLLTMLEGSGLRARIDRDAMAFLPGARDLWRRGLRSTADPANRAAFAAQVGSASVEDEAWLFDPQTSGGLLIAAAPAEADAILHALHAAGEPAPFRIGQFEPAASNAKLAIGIEIFGTRVR